MTAARQSSVSVSLSVSLSLSLCLSLSVSLSVSLPRSLSLSFDINLFHMPVGDSPRRAVEGRQCRVPDTTSAARSAVLTVLPLSGSRSPLQPLQQRIVRRLLRPEASGPQHRCIAALTCIGPRQHRFCRFGTKQRPPAEGSLLPPFGEREGGRERETVCHCVSVSYTHLRAHETA